MNNFETCRSICCTIPSPRPCYVTFTLVLSSHAHFSLQVIRFVEVFHPRLCCNSVCLEEAGDPKECNAQCCTSAGNSSGCSSEQPQQPVTTADSRASAEMQTAPTTQPQLISGERFSGSSRFFVQHFLICNPSFLASLYRELKTEKDVDTDKCAAPPPAPRVWESCLRTSAIMRILLTLMSKNVVHL